MGAGRIPGSLGHHDEGAVIKTPGLTGQSSARAVHRSGPAGAERVRASAKKASRRSTSGKTELSYEEFKTAVLTAHVARSLARGKLRFAPIDDSELETIEGEFRMRNFAAQSCRRLLADARTALKAAQASGDGLAERTRSIGLCSAYRTYAYEGGLWNKAFKKHYDRMFERGAHAGDEHGDAARRYMLLTLVNVKAAPGFSNHSNGMAVDFATIHGGVEYVANTDQQDGWRNTWLYRWLVQNAAHYRFKQLPSEAWHWDYA